jgi:transcriptional regulator GlxA family with amidase domain
VLKPAIMREICFWLLTGRHGADICKIVLPQTHLHRISKAIRFLRENFTRTVRMEELADEARMSPSSFHQHFKAVTGSTPLQYQKQLRLMEARRLMTTEGLNVSAAAFAVGYESASQFSPEYTRMYSKAPKRDVLDLKSLIARLNSPISESVNPGLGPRRATGALNRAEPAGKLVQAVSTMRH